MDYIIVQAGGKGTRLGYLTKNRPKCLVPVGNLPMLFHLFRKYPDKNFIVIADYKKEVLREYLECFAKVKYLVVDAEGEGTCAGIGQAVRLIPEGQSFMLMWSDLILPDTFELPEEYGGNVSHGRDAFHEENTAQIDYIGISKSFPCRWSYKDGEFVELKSLEHGVAGFFLFTEKSKLKNVPESGELVRWIQQEKMHFEEISLAGTKEFGILEEYNSLEKEKCRPFNRMVMMGDRIRKEGIGEQGKKLAERECRWYGEARKNNFASIPIIYQTNPLEMERIQGKNIYECGLAYPEKKAVLVKLVNALHKLHRLEFRVPDAFSREKAYYRKTMERIQPVRDLIPFAEKEKIRINGRECRNVFFHKRELDRKLGRIPCEKFCLIHGDCTFSNLMLRENGEPVMIDPRGYFGYQELYGDPLYDWAKLYYSIVGNYDKFNLKDFRLDIGQEEVKLQIDSSHWEDMEEDFFALTGADRVSIKLLHGIIWLSLTTYAWQDYDSICGAFYNGLYYLEEVL